MSLHINLTEEAELELRSLKKRNLLAATLTAILCTSLLGILLYIAVIVLPEVAAPEITSYVAGDEDAPPSDQQVMQERTTSRPSSASASQASIITSTAPSNISVATVDIDVQDSQIAFGNAEFGDGFGDLGTEGGDFGVSNPSGSVLTGTFYDFKQTRNNAPTNIEPSGATKIMSEFVTGKWKANDFSKFYQSPTKLYNSHFYISRRRATEAPKAYKCEDKVKDSRWCAIYRGNVVAPKSGKFRFVGAGDDNITVRFNNENVFDYGFYMLSYPNRTVPMNQDIRNVMSGKKKDAGMEKQLKETGIYTKLPVDFYQYSSMPHWNKSIQGLGTGKVFEVKAGEIYPIEVLITEIPGGEFGAVLLIQDMDVKTYKKDPKTKAPILPLFRTNDAIPDKNNLKGIGGDIVPFDPLGPIWEVRK